MASANAKALAGLAALAVAMVIGRFAFTPVLPMMLQHGELSMRAGAWLASANYFGYLLGALSALMLNIRPERAIRGGLLVICITTLAMALPLPYVVWLLLRLGAGTASAWVLISVSAWCLATLSGYQRPFLNGLVFAGVGTGIAAAGLLCFFLNKFNAGSSSAWAALGLLASLATAWIWPCFALQLPESGPGLPSIEGSFDWNADAVRLTCCYGIFGFCYIIPATFLPVMAKSVLQDAASFGLSWPVFGLAAALSTLCVTHLARRIGNRRLWMASQWIMALGLVLPILWPQLLSIFAASLCVGGTFMVITLVALQEAKLIAGGAPKILIAAMTSAFAGGQIIGPLTVNAAALGNTGFSTSLAIAAVLLVVSTLLLRKRRI